MIVRGRAEPVEEGSELLLVAQENLVAVQSQIGYDTGSSGPDASRRMRHILEQPFHNADIVLAHRGLGRPINSTVHSSDSNVLLQPALVRIVQLLSDVFESYA